MISNARNVVAYRYTRKSGTVTERPLANARNAVGYSNARKSATT